MRDTEMQEEMFSQSRKRFISIDFQLAKFISIIMLLNQEIGTCRSLRIDLRYDLLNSLIWWQGNLLFSMAASLGLIL